MYDIESSEYSEDFFFQAVSFSAPQARTALWGFDLRLTVKQRSALRSRVQLHTP